MTTHPVGTMGPTGLPGQATTLRHAFNAVTLYDPASDAWNFDTGASSHLNNSVTNLSENFNSCMYPSVSVGDGHSIPVTNTGHSILPTSVRPLHLNNVLITPHIVKNLISVRQFVRDNNCTIEFDAFGFSVKDFMTLSPLPKSYRDAFSDPNWQNAMHDEYHALIKNKTYATLSRYKARLVANSSTQLEGVDVDETFSPVVKPGTIRIVLSLAATRHWPIHQLDVKNAFLHGDLSETVYMYQPPGFWDSVHPDYGTDTAYLLLYVDAIVLTASFEGLLQRIIRSLHQEFAMTDLGPLNYFLGISVTRDSLGLFLSQKKYAVEILEKAHMVNCSLQYLTFTRPDISYVVQQLFSSSTTDLVAYFDADWAGCPTTRRSTSGSCVFLDNNLLSWSSKRQPTLSCSSAEAEYRGVANVVAETCWLHNLLRELHTPLSSATLVYYDNASAVYLSCNPVQH
ncbi:ribonuclease H-like domain-containing protein [Tanacetum coccineum]